MAVAGGGDDYRMGLYLVEHGKVVRPDGAWIVLQAGFG
jgi:hypothetical protein